MPVVSMLDGLHSPLIMSADKGVGSWALAGPRHSCPTFPSPSPSPGEAWLAPPVPGSIQALLEKGRQG